LKKYIDLLKMQNFQFQILKSNKGGNKLLVDGYSHVTNFRNEKIISWRCCIRSCKGKCKTDKDITTLIAKSDHSCSSQMKDDEIDAENKFNKMVDSNILVKPSQILTKFHGTISSSTTLPSDEKLRDKISYRKRKLFGSSSESNNREMVMPKLTNVDGRSFLLHEDKNFIILGTLENLKRLFGNPTWMADGTFSLAPTNFNQIFIISGKIYNRWIPLIYVLMTARTVLQYQTVFNALISVAIDNSIDVPDAPSLILDFEKASSQAFLSEFPKGIVHRCYFHYRNTILKNLKKKGVYQNYLNDEHFKNMVMTIAVLPFLPLDEVLSTFLDITDNCPSYSTPFFKYVDATFIRGKCIRHIPRLNKSIYGNPKYQLSEWNLFTRFGSEIETTTNVQESINHRLSCCNHNGSHPSLFKLAQLLMDFDQRNEHFMNCYIVNGMPELKKRKEVRERDENLNRLHRKYSDGLISKEDYLFGCYGNYII
jgi:hypothetical protein